VPSAPSIPCRRVVQAAGTMPAPGEGEVGSSTRTTPALRRRLTGYPERRSRFSMRWLSARTSPVNHWIPTRLAASVSRPSRIRPSPRPGSGRRSPGRTRPDQAAGGRVRRRRGLPAAATAGRCWAPSMSSTPPTARRSTAAATPTPPASSGLPPPRPHRGGRGPGERGRHRRSSWQRPGAGAGHPAGARPRRAGHRRRRRRRAGGGRDHRRHPGVSGVKS
jgi:hypothetical protein